MQAGLYYIWIGDGVEAPMMSDINFGEMIRHRREELGKTQTDVANASGLAIATYGRIERGIVTPKLVQIVSIFRVLGLPLGTIDEEREKPERMTARDHLAKIEYHVSELKRLLGD